DLDGDAGVDATQDQQVKKMVRLALACEYRRSEIRRGDIGEKVLGSTAQRGAFNKVFERAQEQLQHVFGMEMVELPAKEKVTIAQKRAAQKSSGPSSTKSWIVTSTLPPAFRTPDILSTGDSGYVALYTYIVSIIMLSGGKLPSSKLDRYLRRANADESTPVASTEKLLQRLCKEGYIVKIKDSSSGEEMIDYIIGPRGRVEVGEGGVAGLVKAVYGEAANEELSKRVQRSLALSRPAEVERMVNGVVVDGDKKKRGERKGKRREEGAEEDAEDESD
ncbi:MAGE-domain-containing protein, partial [Viridothelium virens]